MSPSRPPSPWGDVSLTKCSWRVCVNTRSLRLPWIVVDLPVVRRQLPSAQCSRTPLARPPASAGGERPQAPGLISGYMTAPYLLPHAQLPTSQLSTLLLEDSTSHTWLQHRFMSGEQTGRTCPHLRDLCGSCIICLSRLSPKPQIIMTRTRTTQTFSLTSLGSTATENSGVLVFSETGLPARNLCFRYLVPVQSFI